MSKIDIVTISYVDGRYELYNHVDDKVVDKKVNSKGEFDLNSEDAVLFTNIIVRNFDCEVQNDRPRMAKQFPQNV